MSYAHRVVVPAHVKASLAQFHDALRERFGARLERVVLFGSRARGDADEESDVDVLVVVRDLSPAERRDVIDLAYDADATDRERWAGLSPFVLSTARYRELRRRERPIIGAVEREGVVL